MSAVLKRIDDPRGSLERTRRVDLVKYAKSIGMTEITHAMPAILICQRFRAKGINKIPGVVLPVLGSPPGASAMPDPSAIVGSGPEVSAEADLERQFKEQSRKTPAQMTINELGAEMKRLKIKRERRDNMTTLRAKIEAHGQ